MKSLINITRRLEFDAGHRVYGHESKCANLHGHRYRAEITVRGPRLDELGRVIDFSVLKREVGSWIDEHWDHNFLFHPNDPLLELLRSKYREKPLFVMPTGQNPTAENMAAFLLGVSNGILKVKAPMLSVVCVRIYETPNCWADALAE